MTYQLTQAIFTPKQHGHEAWQHLVRPGQDLQDNGLQALVGGIVVERPKAKPGEGYLANGRGSGPVTLVEVTVTSCQQSLDHVGVGRPGGVHFRLDQVLKQDSSPSHIVGTEQQLVGCQSRLRRGQCGGDSIDVYRQQGDGIIRSRHGIDG
jgi:hypothetical protein